MSEDKKELEGTDKVEESKLPVISSAKDIFEKVDTGELVKALETRVTGAWAYGFKMQGKFITGLSAAGADESALFIAQQSKGQTVIRTIPGSLQVIEELDCFKASVMAGVYVIGFYGDKPSELLLSTHYGYSKQLKQGVRQDGSTWDIIHAEVLAVRKAERNAKAHAIPDRIKQQIMSMALKKGRMAKEDPDSAGEESRNGNNKESSPKGNGKPNWNLFWMTAKSNKVSEQKIREFAKKKYGIKESLTELTEEQFDELLEKIQNFPEQGKLL